MQASTSCRPTRAASRLLLSCRKAASPGLFQPFGVLLGEGRACIERVGGLAQNLRQVARGCPGLACCARSMPRAGGGLALGRGPVSEALRRVALLLSLKPAP
jgi:hypothetical protein